MDWDDIDNKDMNNEANYYDDEDLKRYGAGYGKDSTFLLMQMYEAEEAQRKVERYLMGLQVHDGQVYDGWGNLVGDLPEEATDNDDAPIITAGIISLIKCMRLSKKYDKLWAECQQEQERKKPIDTNLPAIGEYTNWTFDWNEPIRRCIQEKDPNLVRDLIEVCGFEMILPSPIPKVPRKRR